MSTESYTCPKGCCNIESIPYTEKETDYHYNKRRKAGIFIYDPIRKKVLLVQSCGQLWGPPKGTSNIGESVINCAIREVKEETGLDIDPKALCCLIKIKQRAFYFYLEMDERGVNVQRNVKGNDANAVGWFSIDCLEKGIVKLNHHCKILIIRHLSPSSKFEPGDSSS